MTKSTTSSTAGSTRPTVLGASANRPPSISSEMSRDDTMIEDSTLPRVIQVGGSPGPTRTVSEIEAPENTDWPRKTSPSMMMRRQVSPEDDSSIEMSVTSASYEYSSQSHRPRNSSSGGRRPARNSDRLRSSDKSTRSSPLFTENERSTSWSNLSVETGTTGASEGFGRATSYSSVDDDGSAATGRITVHTSSPSKFLKEGDNKVARISSSKPSTRRRRPRKGSEGSSRDRSESRSKGRSGSSTGGKSRGGKGGAESATERKEQSKGRTRTGANGKPVTSKDGKAGKGVKFTNLQIRLYDREVGDNPSCSSGPPIGIGWKYQTFYTNEAMKQQAAEHTPLRKMKRTELVIAVDKYEVTRGPRRPSHQLVLSRDARNEMLLANGVSRGRIVDAVRNNIKIKNQRRQTVHNLPFGEIEELMERTSKAFRRMAVFDGEKRKEMRSRHLYEDWRKQEKALKKKGGAAAVAAAKQADADAPKPILVKRSRIQASRGGDVSSSVTRGSSKRGKAKPNRRNSFTRYAKRNSMSSEKEKEKMKSRSKSLTQSTARGRRGSAPD